MYFEMFYRENFCNLHIIFRTVIMRQRQEYCSHLKMYIMCVCVYGFVRVSECVLYFFLIRLLKFYKLTMFTHRKINLQFFLFFSTSSCVCVCVYVFFLVVTILFNFVFIGIFWYTYFFFLLSFVLC